MNTYPKDPLMTSNETASSLKKLTISSKIRNAQFIKMFLLNSSALTIELFYAEVLQRA